MYLEDVAKHCGMVDYYDNVGGKIYELSEAVADPESSSRLIVPVRSVDGFLLGFAYMAKVE